MKRFIKHIAWISTIIGLLFLALNTFLSTYNDEPPHYRLQYQETLNQNGNYNGIIIGNSNATHSIRPSQLDTLDIRFFNLALNGATQNFYLNWYNDVFVKHHPKVNYWIISADHYFVTRNERLLTNDSEYLPFKSFWKFLIEDNDYNKRDLIINRIPLLKYRSRVKGSLNKNTQGKYKFLIEDYDRGYISLEKISRSNNLPEQNHIKRKVSKKAEENFIKLIDRISQDGSKLVFVIPPEYNISENQYKDHKDFLTKLSLERDIPLFDFNDEIYRELLNKRENFCDLIHLNKKGSLILSNLLRKELYQNDNTTLIKK